jgi:hypothetical protein
MEPECSVCGVKFAKPQDAVHIGNGERVCRHTCIADYLGDAGLLPDKADPDAALAKGWEIEGYVTIKNPKGQEVYSCYLDEDYLVPICAPQIVRSIEAARILARKLKS